MAMKRKQRTKNDLSRLSAWPHQVKKKQRVSGVRLASRNEPQPGRTPFRGPIGHELPALYHETYLRILPRDPYGFFSFWEIAPDSLKAIAEKIPAGAATASPLLRLYERDGSAHEKTIGDIPVEKEIRSGYFRVPEPGRRYRLEYGFASPDGFIPLCSSNEIAVPAARGPKVRDSNEGLTGTEAGYFLTGSYDRPADS
jgi:hypothetical protein